MTRTRQSFAFPLAVTDGGGITATGGDEATRGMIIQILFTASGERVHRPEFGSGLANLIFEPNNDLLAASIEFTIGQALARWLADEIIVDAVHVDAEDEMALVEVVYTRKRDLAKQAVRIQFT